MHIDEEGKMGRAYVLKDIVIPGRHDCSRYQNRIGKEQMVQHTSLAGMDGYKGGAMRDLGTFQNRIERIGPRATMWMG